MITTTGEEEPPKSTDLLGWQQAIAGNRLKAIRLEALAAAFQDLGARDTQVQHALTQHLSAAIIHMLRKHVGTNHPNRGEDIIFRAHGDIFAALLQPNSPDGRALRVAFGSRVLFRMKDAIDSEWRERRTVDDIEAEKQRKTRDQHEQEDDADKHIDASEEPQEPEGAELAAEGDEDGFYGPDEAADDGMAYIDQKIDVSRILDCVPHPKKRLAFRLFMDGVPYKSKRDKVETIAQAVGVSERTAREWVKEVQLLLAENEAVKHLQKVKAGERV